MEGKDREKRNRATAKEEAMEELITDRHPKYTENTGIVGGT